MDKLDSLLMQSSPSTQVFYAGNSCETSYVDEAAGMGHLHVLHAGKLTIKRHLASDLDITKPSLILFPRPQTCTLIPESTDEKGAQGASIVCAHVDFGQAMSATLALSIPDVLVIPLDPSNHLKPMLALMFQEAASESCGKKVALNHLMNYFLVLLLRQLMENGDVKTGILAALGDKRLSIAVTAMHDHPNVDWTLETLAEKAGMSRARFASHFRSVTDTTPLEYLTAWRIELTKNQLRQGRSLKVIAPKVGYGSAEALIRSFTRHTHVTPKEWLRLQEV